MQPAIIGRDLHKHFVIGRVRTPILRGVSLQVGAGEIVFFVGPSGSGKTTLLSLLGCILSPDRGAIEVLGRDVSHLEPDELTRFRRDQLGFIFQSFNLLPTLSALDNVRLAFAIRGIARAEAKQRAGRLLDLVDLSSRARLLPSRLSTGECQRVAVARALAGNPSVLFADEPTASLDAENGQAVMRLLIHLVRTRGMTLVVVTHDNRIFPFADRVLRVEDGRLADSEAAIESKLSRPFPVAGLEPGASWAWNLEECVL